MTGYSGVMTAQKVRELGFRELLSKPISLRTLGETVHRVLQPTVSSKPEPDALFTGSSAK
jgi:DNA-binding NtrC family response regulator